MPTNFLKISQRSFIIKGVCKHWVNSAYKHCNMDSELLSIISTLVWMLIGYSEVLSQNSEFLLNPSFYDIHWPTESALLIKLQRLLLLCIPVRKEYKVYTKERPVSYIKGGNVLFFFRCCHKSCANPPCNCCRSEQENPFYRCVYSLGKGKQHSPYIFFINFVHDPNLNNFLGQQTHNPCGNKNVADLSCISKPKTLERKKILQVLILISWKLAQKALDWDST